MVFTEVSVEVQLSKVSQQLDSSALHHVLAEMHHAVQVVEMSGFGVAVAFSVHCDEARDSNHIFKYRPTVNII